MNQPQHALRRARREALLAGVLAGMARYFGISTTRLRIAFLTLAILSAGFPGILAYLALWFTIPGES